MRESPHFVHLRADALGTGGAEPGFCRTHLASVRGALRAAPLQARAAWIAWILGLVLVGLITPPGFQSLAGLPEPLRGWLRGLRVDAYLVQAAAFPLRIGVLSLWRRLQSRS